MNSIDVHDAEILTLTLTGHGSKVVLPAATCASRRVGRGQLYLWATSYVRCVMGTVPDAGSEPLEAGTPEAGGGDEADGGWEQVQEAEPRRDQGLAVLACGEEGEGDG